MANVDEPSAFWATLNREHEEYLREDFGNFKRTVATQYFTWLPTLRQDQFHHLIRKTRLRDWPSILSNIPAPDGLSRWRWTNLCIYVRMLYLYSKRFDRLGLIDQLREPAFGNPFLIPYRNRLLSQDIIHSVLELYAMLDELDFSQPLKVCEIGAGYGRVAWLFLTLFPDCEYTIIDIEPAINVSKAYLRTVCPNAKVSFLSPADTEGLPNDCFDLTINISSFHEMTPAQVDAYFDLIDRTSKRLYLKQWRCWHNPIDDVVMSEASYPYRPSWKKVYSRTNPVKPSFFEAVYLIRT
jgi:putative sugar O-methyltransferase